MTSKGGQTNRSLVYHQRTVEKALEESKKLSKRCEDLEESIQTLKNTINTQAAFMEGVGSTMLDMAKEVSEHMKEMKAFKQEQEQVNEDLHQRINHRRGEINDINALVRTGSVDILTSTNPFLYGSRRWGEC